MAKDEWVRVAGIGEVEPGEMIPVEIEGRNIALFHLDDGEWHATGNICSHSYALLTDGWLEDHEVECPLHAARFDVRTGAALCAPASEKIAVFAVKVEGQDVLVRIG